MPVGTAINENELKQVRAKFDTLLEAMEPSLQDEDKSYLEKAYSLAVDAHNYQRRKSGEPYIFHPIEVARICFEEIGLGPTAIVCALLHDVVEDTPVTLEDIKEQFGPKVTVIVDGLTKLDGTYDIDVSDSPQAENFKKVLSTLIVDVRVVLIKMADRLHNLRTIDAQAKHKQLKIAAETEYIYTPLAHRLGLYNIKTEFQDICLRITDSVILTRQEISTLKSLSNHWTMNSSISECHSGFWAGVKRYLLYTIRSRRIRSRLRRSLIFLL